jgi:hypothetical protein
MAEFRGSFVSTGASVKLPFVADVEWIQVLNQTQLATAQTVAVGVKYYWQANASTNGDKYVTFKSDAANAVDLEQYITTNGFYAYDDSAPVNGALQATITAVSNAAIPVVSAMGHGLVPGDVVRVFNVVGAAQLGDIDFTVGYNTLTANTFSLDYMPQIVAGTTGSFRKVPGNPAFYPPRRFITKIESVFLNGNEATEITLSVTHSFKVGQSIRINVPDIRFGMTQINGLTGTILSVDTTVTTGNNIVVNIDSSSFTPFVYVLTADYAYSPALVVPVGMDSAAALDLGVDFLSDATVNTATAGLVLTGGADCPGGSVNMGVGDVMVWRAGTAETIPVGNSFY